MKNFLLVMFILLIQYATATSDDLSWYFLTDELRQNPQLLIPKFHRIILRDKGINFYTDTGFKGQPHYLVTGNIKSLASGEICSVEVKRFNKESKRWLECLPYSCKVKSSATSLNLKLVDKISSDLYKTAKETEKCSFTSDLKIQKNFGSDHNSFLVLDAKNNPPFILINGSKFFPDLRDCDSGARQCELDVEADRDQPSITSLKNAKGNMWPGLAQFKSCLEPRLDSKCLTELSIKSVEELSESIDGIFMFKYFKPISWSDENVNELRECIKLGNHLYGNYYRGLKKKCLFHEGKIAVIDFPEAFYRRDFNGENYNTPLNYEF